jgi:hypothetical protein
MLVAGVLVGRDGVEALLAAGEASSWTRHCLGTTVHFHRAIFKDVCDIEQGGRRC